MKASIVNNDFQWALHELGEHDNIFVVAIEGIIGTGKSTLIERMEATDMLKVELDKILHHSKVHVQYVVEPVHRWRAKEEGGNGMLEDFYQHKEANAYPFQVQVFEDHVDVVRNAIGPYLPSSGNTTLAGQPMVLVMERSMFSQLLFWRQQIEDGFTTQTQRDRYWRQFCTWTRYVPVPALYVLLRVPHEEDNGCDDRDERLRRELRRIQRRIQARGRGEEMSQQQDDDATASNGDKTIMKQSLGNWDGAGEPLDQEFMAYNGKLLARHEMYWPSGACNPEELLERAVGCVHCDASRPYDNDNNALREVAREIAGFLSTNLVIAGHGPVHHAHGH